jgi:hypothetical protein
MVDENISPRYLRLEFYHRRPACLGQVWIAHCSESRLLLGTIEGRNELETQLAFDAVHTKRILCLGASRLDYCCFFIQLSTSLRATSLVQP